MITLRIRWKVVYQIACVFKGHDWHEYGVIHPAWNWPGRYCSRCAKSCVRESHWEVVDGTAKATEQVEKWRRWISVEVSS